MSGLWLNIGLVCVLVLLNAAFAGSEIALVSLREGQIDNLQKRGGRAALLARLARDPNRFLATIQIGITLAGFLASATAAVSLARPLMELLGFLGGAARPVSIVIVTAVLTFVTLVVGELAPKRVALQRAEGWGLVAARPLSVLATITRPLVALLGKATDLTVKLMGGDPAVQREEITKDELRDMVRRRPELHPLERSILSEGFQLSQRSLRQVLVPRPDVLSVRSDMPVHEAIDALLAAGHSRAPVEGESIDDIRGVVHLRDLVGEDGPIEDHMRDALVFPESMPVTNALRDLQRKRLQIAIVIDEHGGTEGIVTIEDMFEELVGEIYDEFDRDLASASQEPDGSYVLEGSFPVHDLEELGLPAPTGPYSTIAGLILNETGELPATGQTLEAHGLELKVLEVTGTTITKVRVRQTR